MHAAIVCGKSKCNTPSSKRLSQELTHCSCIKRLCAAIFLCKSFLEKLQKWLAGVLDIVKLLSVGQSVMGIR